MIRISVGRTYWWKGSLWNVVERFSSGFASPELVVVQRLATGGTADGARFTVPRTSAINEAW